MVTTRTTTSGKTRVHTNAQEKLLDNILQYMRKTLQPLKNWNKIDFYNCWFYRK